MKSVRFSIVDTLKYAFYASLEYSFFFFMVLLTWTFSLFLSVGVFAAVFLYPAKDSIMALVMQSDMVDKAEFSKMVIYTFSEKLGVLGILFFVSLFIFVHFLQFGLVRIVLDIHDTGSSSIRRLFSSFPMLLKALAVHILYYCMVFGGLFLFIIPGIIADVMFAFALYTVIDAKTGVIDAFKKSAALTQGTRTHLFALFLILLVIRYFFMSVAVVANIIFWPVNMLAMVYVYRRLQLTASA